MYISPRPPRPPENDLAPRGSPLAVVAFALFSVVAAGGMVLLQHYGIPAPACGEDPACLCSGP